MRKILTDLAEGIDEPLDIPEPIKKKLFFKAGKVRFLIINEDGSFNEYFHKLPDSYMTEIKGKSYLVLPKCIIRGKYPTIIYFFNNPFPLLLEFKYSDIQAADLYNSELLDALKPEEKVTLANITLDSEAINLAFNSRVMRGLYARQGITPKVIIIILVVVVVIILLVLQLTGVVDVWGAITGQPTK